MKILQLIDLYKTGGAEKVYDMFSQYCYTRNISVERLVLYGEKAENDEKQYIVSKEHASLLRKLIDQYRCICSVHKLIRRKEISRLVGFLDRSNLVFVFAFLFDSKRPEITATVHNPPTIQYLKLNTFIRRIFLESLSWAYNRRWVKVIAVSQDVKDSLSSIGVRNIQVIHNPVSFRQEVFELPLVPIEEYLIAIGRLEYQKGYWKLLKAFAWYKATYCDTALKLYIFGAGSQEDALKNLSVRLGISESVIFWGYQQTVGDYIVRAKAVVFSSFYEGFSIALLECMSAHKPFIGSEASMPQEIRCLFEKSSIVNYYVTYDKKIDFSLFVHDDEKELGVLINKIQVEKNFSQIIADIGCNWVKENCRETNFDAYLK